MREGWESPNTGGGPTWLRGAIKRAAGTIPGKAVRAFTSI